MTKQEICLNLRNIYDALDTLNLKGYANCKTYANCMDALMVIIDEVNKLEVKDNSVINSREGE